MKRNVTIRPVLNGFICEVGCQTVVFTDKQTMLNELSNYCDKPCETEKRFTDRAINPRWIPNPAYATAHCEPMAASADGCNAKSPC